MATTKRWLVLARKGRATKEYTVRAATRPEAVTLAKRKAPTGWTVIRCQSYRHLGIGD